MYKKVLVDRLIEDGRRVLAQLDAQGMPVQAAVWTYQPEPMIWKLVIVTDVANRPGPLEAYMRIQKAMYGLDLELALDDIIVMSPDSRNFEEFRRTMEGVAKRALATGDSGRKGISFYDAYVYRWPD